MTATERGLWAVVGLVAPCPECSVCAAAADRVHWQAHKPGFNARCGLHLGSPVASRYFFVLSRLRPRNCRSRKAAGCWKEFLVGRLRLRLPFANGEAGDSNGVMSGGDRVVLDYLQLQTACRLVGSGADMDRRNRAASLVSLSFFPSLCPSPPLLLFISWITYIPCLSAYMSSLDCFSRAGFWKSLTMFLGSGL